MADRFFNDESAVGKTFRLDNAYDVTVTSVFTLPSNSTLNVNFILPYEIYAKQDIYNEEWGDGQAAGLL